MSGITVQPKINQLKSASRVVSTRGQVAAMEVPKGIFAIAPPEQISSKPITLFVHGNQAGVLDKVLGLLKRLQYRSKPHDPDVTLIPPTENPYDRTFAGHLMVHL
jgi:hypothetical protein